MHNAMYASDAPDAVGPYRSRLKAYGVTTETRFEYVKDVPTLTELGLPVVGESWLGVLAPPNTPPEIISTLSDKLREIVSSPDYRDRLNQMGLAPIDLDQPQFAKYYLDAYKKWGEVIQAGHIRAD